MSLDQMVVLLDVIAELPHRFIWRWDDLSLDKPLFKNLPTKLRAILTNNKKLYRSTWLPQIDIFGTYFFILFIFS
jgi:hypothetical protein